MNQDRMCCPLCNRTDRLKAKDLAIHLAENHLQEESLACASEPEKPKGSYTPTFPPNSIAGKAEVRRHGIPRCPICGAEMMNGNNRWQCGMKHEGDPPVEHRAVGGNPPNRDFDGMEASFDNPNKDDGLWIGKTFIGESQRYDDNPIFVELARRWNAEPGLRREFKEEQAVRKINWEQYLAEGRKRMESEKISEARRRALVRVDKEYILFPELKTQIENAIAGAI